MNFILQYHRAYFVVVNHLLCCWSILNKFVLNPVPRATSYCIADHFQIYKLSICLGNYGLEMESNDHISYNAKLQDLSHEYSNISVKS